MSELAGRELAGQVALVTGAGINTGSVICRKLAAAGAAVCVNYRNQAAGAKATVAAIEKAGGRAIAVQADVTRPEDVARLVARTVAAFGGLTILVNNANIRSFRPLDELTFEEFRATVATTLDATFLCVKAAVPHMKQAGKGAIVNIGGGSGHNGRPYRAHVAAAKAGMAGMTGCLASELAPHNIVVNCIVPGKVDTSQAPSAHSSKESDIPLGRAGTPEEIAELTLFLAGDRCRFMSGCMLHVNGAKYITIA